MPEANTDPITEHKRRAFQRLGRTSPKLDKLLRKLSRAEAHRDEILLKPEGDPLWADREFWDTRWPAMVDRVGELREQVTAEELRLPGY